ncbi:hypothetical protein FDI23_gp092 [Serratia phage CHI14]|uniref:Uncharacterized protein n=2 Tax=Winklervirus chi14 TaxID=2560752 RepID=A0A1Z1LY82_9CAUD|nr:hypothetical protein FDI23_gp092 [Serratia phage CHI14]ARW57515.1 hypothetical protein [Serratia phage CHI14]ARW57790.1 hypothetical protein [Serratia phage CBH8]
MNNWVQNTSIYPPAHIYAGKPQGKQEKAAVRICEELYKFNHGTKPNTLGELRSAWRELIITEKMEQSGPSHMSICPEYWAQVIGTFLYWAREARREMDSVFKQHQDVWAYYKPWALKDKEIVQWVYDFTIPTIYVEAIKVHDILQLKYQPKEVSDD